MSISDARADGGVTTASRIAISNGIDVAYSEHGDGEPLVLIMGLGADKSAWVPHLEAYEKHFRCFAVDNRGAGGSSKPPGPYSTMQMADDYAGLIEQLDVGRVRVVGISMGGAIAQELALRHRDLVERLVLVSAWARCDDYTSEVFWHFSRVRAAVEPAVFAQLLQLWIWTPSYLNQHLAELREARHAPADMPQHAFEAQCQACIAHDAADRLHAVRAPTLVTAGNADIFTPLSLAEELKARIPSAELHVFPDSGHAHHWENVDEFNRLTIDWLA